MVSSSPQHHTPPKQQLTWLEQRSLPVDWELLFCSHVLELPALHWGLWDAGQELTLAGLQRAQRRFTAKVVSALGQPTGPVLDVGCGRGDASELLARSGVPVVALAPIANYLPRMHALAPQGVQFVMQRFEDYAPQGRFAHLLMSESCGYFPARTAFARAARLLVEGGTLTVANMFRREPVSLPVGKHLLGDFLREAAQAGFDLSNVEDITEGVLPTLELYQDVLVRRVNLAADLVQLAMRRQSRWGRRSARLAAWLTAPLLARAQLRYAAYAARFDAKSFREYSTYRVMKFVKR